MVEKIIKSCRLKQTKFSFGATSGIITNLGIIVGFDKVAHPRLSIVGAILIIAIADNISDSLGIHIYQESECLSSKEVWFSTATNFLSRLLVSLSFIVLVLAMPLAFAVTCSVIWGLFLLSILSYTIARTRGVNPRLAIFEHLCIASVVILASNFLSTRLMGIVAKF